MQIAPLSRQSSSCARAAAFPTVCCYYPRQPDTAVPVCHPSPRLCVGAALPDWGGKSLFPRHELGEWLCAMGNVVNRDRAAQGLDVLPVLRVEVYPGTLSWAADAPPIGVVEATEQELMLIARVKARREAMEAEESLDSGLEEAEGRGGAGGVGPPGIGAGSSSTKGPVLEGDTETWAPWAPSAEAPSDASHAKECQCHAKEGHWREASIANALMQRYYETAKAAAFRAAPGTESHATMFAVECGLAYARSAAHTARGLGEHIPPAARLTQEPVLLYVVRGDVGESCEGGACLGSQHMKN